MRPAPIPWPCVVLVLLAYDALLWALGRQTFSNFVYVESLENPWLHGAYVVLVVYLFLHLFMPWWPL
jgi:hypothetical protein